MTPRLPHPLEAEYCRALFIVASSKVSVGPFFTSMDADRKGKVSGLGAPPAKEIRDAGDRCCSSASEMERLKTVMNRVRVPARGDVD